MAELPPKDEDPPKNENPFKAKLHEFTQSTTIHSVSRQTMQSSLPRRLMWSIFFFTSLSYAIYQCIESVSRYLRDPITVNNTWRVFSKLEFPAITVCNLNALRKSKVENSSFYSFVHEVSTL